VGDKVNVTIAISDDKDVPLGNPGASDADLLRSDHVELWYSTGDKAGRRQLGIARMKDGAVHARWLYPRKLTAALPAIGVVAPNQYRVTFPAAEIFQASRFFPSNRYTTGFTAVFSDTDVPGKKQEAVIATSRLKWADPNTFGQLVWLENGARFPPLPEGSRIEVTVTDR
jgi:hypothetical protein